MTLVSWDDLIKQAAAGSFDPLPNGEYDTTCIDAQASTSSNGKSMVKAQFRVQNGPHAGRRIWNQFTVSPENPNALKFFFDHMKVLGMDAGFFASLPSPTPELGANDPALGAIAATMLNRPCRLKLEQQIWNGQPRNNVVALLPAYGPAGPVMGPTAPGGWPPAPVVPTGYPQPANYPPQPGMPAGIPTQYPPQPAYQQPDPWAQDPWAQQPQPAPQGAWTQAAPQQPQPYAPPPQPAWAPQPGQPQYAPPAVPQPGYPQPGAYPQEPQAPPAQPSGYPVQPPQPPQPPQQQQYPQQQPPAQYPPQGEQAPQHPQSPQYPPAF